MVIFYIIVILLIVQGSTQYSINRRIINGEDASPNEFPFMASIQVGHPPVMAYTHECAGVVLDEYWVLSTAVCIKSASNVFLGTTRVKIDLFFTNKDENKTQMFQIDEIFIHENFTGSRNLWMNDIALVRLETAIPHPRPAILSKSGDALTGEVLLLGWGKTSSGIFGKKPTVLQYGQVFILDNLSCKLLLIENDLPFDIQNSQFCTHSPSSHIAGCNGDSGGPVIQYVNGKPEIIGLISWNLCPSEEDDVPSISTRISPFIEWIHENMEEHTVLPVSDLLPPFLLTK